MIEFCTKRRMIISCLLLGVLTVLILILEEQFASEHRWSQPPTPVPQNNGSGSSSDASSIKRSSLSPQQKSVNGCWLTENFQIVVSCAPCTHFEINSGSIPACALTGLKETVHCISSGTVFRSCSVSTNAEKIRFWIFEGLMLLTAVVSFGFCQYRTTQLERATIQQIERRLASGM